MKEYTYRDRIRQDLANLNYYRFAIVHEQKELETVEAEFTAIKATNYDKMPTGSGENQQEEKLINAMAKKEELESNIALNKRRVANLEWLLDQLHGEERLVIEKTVVNGESDIAVAFEISYDRTQIWRIRGKALTKLGKLRYGAAFQP